MKSPNSREMTLGVTHRLGTRGSVRLDGVFRDFRDFYATRTDLATGQVADQFGRRFDLQITENTNDVERTYRGMNFQIGYRAIDRLNLGGNYTLGYLKGSFEERPAPADPAPPFRSSIRNTRSRTGTTPWGRSSATCVTR